MKKIVCTIIVVTLILAGAAGVHARERDIYPAEDIKFFRPAGPIIDISPGDANGQMLYWDDDTFWTKSDEAELKWDASTNILSATNIDVDHIGEKTGSHDVVFDNHLNMGTKRIKTGIIQAISSGDQFDDADKLLNFTFSSPTEAFIIPEEDNVWSLGDLDGQRFKDLALSGNAVIGGNVDITGNASVLGTFAVGEASPTETVAFGDGVDLLFNSGQLISPFGGFGAFQNLLTYTQDFRSITHWTHSNIASAGSATGPDGISAVCRIVNGGGGNGFMYEDKTVSTSTSHVFSIWIKGSGAQDISIQLINQNGDAGTTTNSITLDTNWRRYFVVHTTSGTTTSLRSQINHTASGSDVIFTWGAQLEENSAPGLYVISKAATASSTAGKGFLINGTLQAEHFRNLTSSSVTGTNANVFGSGSATSQFSFSAGFSAVCSGNIDTALGNFVTSSGDLSRTFGSFLTSSSIFLKSSPYLDTIYRESLGNRLT